VLFLPRLSLPTVAAFEADVPILAGNGLAGVLHAPYVLPLVNRALTTSVSISWNSIKQLSSVSLTIYKFKKSNCG